MQLRILHAIEPAPFGGAETVVTALAKGSAARGNAVAVAALRQRVTGGDFVAALQAGGVSVSEIQCGRRRYLREVRDLERLIRDWRANVLHTHGYHADIVGYFAGRRAGVPVLSTAHGFTGGSLKNRFYEWLDIQALKRFDAVVCVSPLIRKQLEAARADPERLHLIPNGHDGSQPMTREAARAELGLDPQARIVGWIGRLSHEKGPDRFVHIMGSLRSNARGVMIGDGPERVNVERDVAATDAPLTLVGARPDAARLVTAFDVLAVTSRTEGLPMTVLNAMAAGVPVVATAVGALPEVLADGAGWLALPTDAEALAACVRSALQDPAEAERRAHRALERLRDTYSLDRWLDRIEALYDRLNPRSIAQPMVEK